MNYFKNIMLLVMLAGINFTALAQDVNTPYEGVAGWAETKDKRMEWFREARFGLFIHWGLYSAAGGSWDGKQYPQHYAEWIQAWAKVPSKTYGSVLKPQFTATKFNADEWASLAEQAGMKYLIITSRHHEGFSIFNSQQSYALDNKVTGGTNISPAGRDLYGEVVTAFRKRGLKAGAYYSLLDWQHPDSYEGLSYVNSNPDGYKPNHESYKDFLYGQVKELANNYDGLDVLWLDFSTKKHQGESWGAKRILTDLIKWQPNIIVNNRFWDGLENKNGDIGTPEKYIPPTGLPGMDWEVSHTMNESYGYSAHDQKWKSYDQTMRLFLETVSKGGNFLLNVGPDGEGAIPQQAKTLLQDIGNWMTVNSASIYGTQASPFGTLDWGYSTQKEGKIFLHVFDVPTDAKITVPLTSAINKAYLMDKVGQRLQVNTTKSGKVIQLPDSFKGPKPLVVVLEISGKPVVIKSEVSSQQDGRLVLTANNARLHAEYGMRLIGASVQNPHRPNAIGGWTNVNDWVLWDVKIQRPGKYNVVLTYLPKEGKTGKVALTVAGQELQHAFAAEKSTRFMEVPVGTITVSQQAIGDASLAVQLKALQIDGDSLPEISAVTLVPVD